jgi:hypothetical protein
VSNWKWLAPILIKGLQQEQDEYIRSKLYAIIVSLIFGKNNFGYEITDPFPIPPEVIDIDPYPYTKNCFSIFNRNQQQELMRELVKGCLPLQDWTQSHIDNTINAAQKWIASQTRH